MPGPWVVAWARAAFEQGAAPFPAADAWHCPGIQSPRRPDVPSSRSFARLPATCHYACVWWCQGWYGESTGAHCLEGWLPMAAAMLGTEGKPPMWASMGLRPVVGTTIDLKVRPTPLSDRERLLLLSCWQQWNPADVQGSTLSHWLVGWMWS